MARTLGAAQFGAFSLAYVTYSFALNASRGLATDPLMVRFSGTDLPTWRRAVANCTGTAAVWAWPPVPVCLPRPRYLAARQGPPSSRSD